MEDSKEDSKKLKIVLLYHPAIPLLGIYPKGKKTWTWKVYLHVNSGIIYNGQSMKTTCFYQYKWINCGAVEYYSAIKKSKEILLFAATWVDIEGIMLSVINLTEKDKSVWSHLYVKSISKKQRQDFGYKRWQLWGDVAWWRY